MYAPKLNADGTRRKSIAWPHMPTNHEGKRAALFGLFNRRGSLAAAAPAEESEAHRSSKGEGADGKDQS